MTESAILKSCNSLLKKVSAAPALSCVESYFIVWLNEFFSIEKLYPETIVSYLRAEKIIQDCSYKDIATIERVQNIAEREAIVTHEKRGDCPLRVRRKTLVLFQVNKDFFETRQTAWRDDHYVQFVAEHNDYVYVVNQYPLEVRKLTHAEFMRVTEGSLIFQLSSENRFRQRKVEFKSGYCSAQTPDIESFRDSLMLYRILLKRLKALLPSDGRLDKLLEKADKLFFCAALAVRKKNETQGLICSWRSEIIRAENEYLAGGI